MLQAKKAPEGQLCPIEAQHITELFKTWCAELEKTPGTLAASERVFLSEIVFLGIQEQRCAAIISKGKAAQLVQVNPKEVHPETLDPLTWEKVIHANVLRLDQISINRSRLLREWMLTPEQKAKQARWDNKSKNTDQSSKQSLIADKIRQITKSRVQSKEIQTQDSEDPQTTDSK
jgi:Cu2+-containing amine oxidase